MARRIAAPEILPETAAFWEAANESRLLLRYCTACNHYHHFPREICPHCLSTQTQWRDSAGAGSVYSFSRMGHGEDAYTIAFVALDEGVTMMTNLIHSDTRSPAIGARVQVCFQAASNGQHVPMFDLKD